MASVNLLVRSTKNPANIDIRFSNGRTMDFFVKTNVLINPIHWDKKSQKIRNLIEIKNRDLLNSKLSSLKTFVIDQYNLDFAKGEIIDRNWLNKSVGLFFNRPKEEKKLLNENHRIFYYDYSKHWIDVKSKEWKTAKNKFLSERAVQQYERFLEIFEDFEAKNKMKYRINQVDSRLISDIIDYMENVKKYDTTTIKRQIGRLRFFLNRANSENMEVDNSYKDKVYLSEREEVLEPYLNEIEINNIYNFDLAHDEDLDNARDNFIIGLWTGLRVGDFINKLNVSNISEDFIEIQTTKTGIWTTIPLHPQVRNILKKRFGCLPKKISDQHFNKKIKTICMLAGIDTKIKGKLFDTKLKRNKIGVHEKYLLVSSHICRRSFATNLFGVVPNSVIMSVGAWKKEETFLHYIKKSKQENAEVLSQVWRDKYNVK
jgi:site-specific recombinase XerD